MRHLTLAAFFSALLTFGAAAALRADSAALAVVAMAALAAAFAWFAAQQTTEEASGLALTGPAAALVCTLAGRLPGGALLPLVTAQALGAGAAGLLAWALRDPLGLTLGWTRPDPLGLGAVAVVLGLLAGWLIAFIDGYLSEGLAALPVLIGGGLMPVGYALAANPAVLVGLSIAQILTWPTSLAAIAGVLVGTVIAGYSLSWVADPNSE